MYEKIAQTMNDRYGSCDMDAGLVEDYLRYGDDTYISAHEQVQIDALLDQFL